MPGVLRDGWPWRHAADIRTGDAKLHNKQGVSAVLPSLDTASIPCPAAQ